MLLPASILERGVQHHNEWAWKICDIPHVIEAARAAQLLNIGGQLQFRLPEIGTCELYWIEVNTSRLIPPDIPWRDCVEKAAELALSQFQELSEHYDFLREGQSAFGPHFDEFRARGGEPRNAMCFVWYLKKQR